MGGKEGVGRGGEGLGVEATTMSVGQDGENAWAALPHCLPSL